MERNPGQVKVQMADITALVEVEFELEFSELLTLYLSGGRTAEDCNSLGP